MAFSALVSPAAAEIGEHYSLYGDYLAGRFALSQRDNEAAVEFFREALRKDPENVSIIERTFNLEVATADMQAAAKLAKQLLEIDEDHHLARLVLGVDALRARQYAAARRYFADGGATGPVTELTNTLMTAWSEQGAGDLDAALETLKGLDGGEWLTVYRAYHSALLADLAGDEEKADEYFAEAYRLDESVLRIAESYARFLARNGRHDEALAVLAAYDKVSRDHPNTTALRATLEAGRTPAPFVGDPAAGAAESLYQIGGLLARQGGEDIGVIYLQLALHLKPNATMALLTLADIYERQRNYELAAEAYARVPETAPLHLSAQIQRAHNLDALEQVEQAKSVLKDLIAAHPDETDPVRALGDIERSHDQFAEAAEMYSAAIDMLEPIGEDNWSLLYYRGICYERTKRWPQAEADFLRALELQPDQPFVLNYLGYSWVDQGNPLERAMEMIRKAVELR
ncbi:MAG TPA: tetratricopeptide repeat protein, partial [Hyphomicrobiales bacterium]|nr:tetratricopeptide repeat protein [Hyphomicrobiales bacterium]